MTKAKFTSTEWKLLLNAPRWVYVALTAAERGTISTKRSEAKALDKFLSGYRTRSALVKEIIAGQEEADDKLKGSLKEAEKALGRVGALLERKVDDDEGDAVRDMLMRGGQAIASATREALFGDAESAKEAKALALVETALKATEADQKRRREAAAKAKAEAERRDQEAKARAEAARKREEAARAEAEAKAEAEAQKKAAEEAKKKAEAEAQKKAEAAKKKAEAKAKAAELKAKQAEARARREAAAKAREEAEAKAAEERIYVVKKGDTLSGIAKQVYGKAGRWPEIFEANKDVIENPNLIRPGWKLRIPE